MHLSDIGGNTEMEIEQFLPYLRSCMLWPFSSNETFVSPCDQAEANFGTGPGVATSTAGQHVLQKILTLWHKLCFDEVKLFKNHLCFKVGGFWCFLVSSLGFCFPFWLIVRTALASDRATTEDRRHWRRELRLERAQRKRLEREMAVLRSELAKCHGLRKRWAKGPWFWLGMEFFFWIGGKRRWTIWVNWSNIWGSQSWLVVG